MPRSVSARLALAFAALVVIMQAVPYGRDHSNPPVISEPQWDAPRTQELAKQACFDCHSNQTRWPWYSHVAPVSWMLQQHVTEARSKLNFSEWANPQRDADEAHEVVAEGEMPLPGYVMLHGEADLSDEDRQVLAAGLEKTVSGNPPPKAGGKGGDDQ